VRAERRALRDESPWRRVLAARRLGLLRSDPSRRALRRALVRGPELVTLHAAMALGRARDRGALRWLLNHPECLASRSPAALVGVLRAFGSGALPDLAAALKGGLDSLRLERAVIEALGLGGEHAARAALEQRLSSGDLDLRVSAVRALGRIQAIESTTALLGALKDDTWQVRAQAARALGEVGATLAIPALATRLTDPSWWVRRHAAYALHHLGHDGQVALRRVAETSPDTYAREMAGEALEGHRAPPPASMQRPRLRRRRA
jgi:HEAT repeat protein